MRILQKAGMFLSDLLRRTGAIRDDPLFGRLRWTGCWEREFRTPEGVSAGLSVSSKAIDREDVRRLFSQVMADLEAVHQRLADEHLPGLNEFLGPQSHLTRDEFLSRFQLCGIHVNPNGCVYVEFGDESEEDLLTGHGIGFFFHLDGTVETTGSG